MDRLNTIDDIAEIIRPTRPRTWDYWLVLLLVVGPIWSITPLSWAYTIFTLWNTNILYMDRMHIIVFVVAVIEVLFSLYHYYLIHSISKPGDSHDPTELPEMQVAFHRVLQSGLLQDVIPADEIKAVPTVKEKWTYHQADAFEQLKPDDPRAIDFRNALRPWFRNMPWSTIGQQDLRRWLYWAVFNAVLPDNQDDLPHAHKTAMEDVMELIRRRTGTDVQPGSNLICQPLMLTLDPVNVWSRPLLWYIFVAVVNGIAWKHIQSKWDVRHGKFQGLEYILRMPTSKPGVVQPQPIVLLHGLGLGLFQYTSLLCHMFNSMPDRPILVPLQPHISQRIFHPSFLTPLGRHKTADALAGLLKTLDWVHHDQDDVVKSGASVEKPALPVKKGVTILSHSNGSFVHAWMLKAYPDMVYRSCFVDPVAFCVWEGDVCNNFIYRHARNGLELVMRYFVGSELGVANLMQRNFDWSANALWYEEIPHARDPTRAMYVVGGKDAIVNAERVKRYLYSHGVRDALRFCPEGHHGQALLQGTEEHDEIMKWLEQES